MAAAAFWIALAAVLVANSWRSQRVESLRHETLRLLIQRDGKLDPAQLKDLLYPPHPPLPPGHPWAKRRPGEGYRVLRVFGTILMSAAFGVGALVAGIGIAQGEQNTIAAGIGAAVFVFLLGAGLFSASRFVAPPESQSGTPQET